MCVDLIVVGGGMAPRQSFLCALIVTGVLVDANGKTIIEINNYYRSHWPNYWVYGNWPINLAEVN